MNPNTFALLKEHGDITTWISPKEFSHTDVCRKFGVDIEYDQRNAFLWKMMLDKKVVVKEDLLDWCGYRGKKNHFLDLLNANAIVEHKEVLDDITNESNIELTALEFELLLNQMPDPKAQELREIYMFLKHIFGLYTTYQLQQAEKKYSEVRIKLTEARKSVRENVAGPVRADVAPNVAPSPINDNKIRRLALLRIRSDEWYFIRRQKETMDTRIAKVLKKYENNEAYKVKVWEGVSHAIDICNEVKERLSGLKWHIKGNVLKYEGGSIFTDEDMVKVTNDICDNNPGFIVCRAADEIGMASQPQ